jgi:KTSC domain
MSLFGKLMERFRQKAAAELPEAKPPTLAEEKPGEFEEFLYFGAWLPVSSSWVSSAQYDVGLHRLILEFHGDTFCQYDGVSQELAESFARAPSKGKWVHAHLMHPSWPYLILAGGERKGEWKG